MSRIMTKLGGSLQSLTHKTEERFYPNRLNFEFGLLPVHFIYFLLLSLITACALFQSLIPVPPLNYSGNTAKLETKRHHHFLGQTGLFAHLMEWSFRGINFQQN